jgi:NAD(P)-dependent dehydrogenase (short-subunit alcohol dehydrogenase family)
LRVSIITGAGSGIGAAVARRLAKLDACLVLHGQGRDAAGISRLQNVAAECEKQGARVSYSTGDLAKSGTASARPARNSAASMRSCMRRALRTGAVSRNCRAAISNARSR